MAYLSVKYKDGTEKHVELHPDYQVQVHDETGAAVDAFSLEGAETLALIAKKAKDG